MLRGADLSPAVSDTDPQQVGVAPLSPRATAVGAERTAELIGELDRQSRKVLAGMEKGEAVKATDLSNWLERKAPPKDTLFQGVAESTAKPAN